MVIWNSQSQSKTLAFHILLASVVVILTLYTSLVFRKVSRDFARFRAQDAKLSLDLARLDGILADTKTFEGDVATVSASLPASYKGTAQFMAQLESIAAASGVTINDTQLDASPTVEGQRSTLKISQKLQTSFASLQTYMHAVAMMPYHTQLVELSINGGVTTVVQNLYMK